jgi:hypothetical protein
MVVKKQMQGSFSRDNREWEMADGHQQCLLHGQ